MNIITRWRAAGAAVVAAGAALALSACIVSPGKFDSTLDLRRDGSFTFTYNGQIYLLALSKLAEMGNEAEEEFTESSCYDDETFEDRPCTEEEIAEQRQTWELGADERNARREREAEQMKRFLGGIDPADPAAAEELATRLRRQQGWKRVDYRGDGLFEVEFSISSRFGHDFAFPTMERFPMSNSFVVANARQGNTVRIEAPGFAAEEGTDTFQSMMGAAALPVSTGEGNETPFIPEMDGTFRIVTDGQILANNTDEGPAAGSRGQVLEWKVNRRTQSAPMALIQLGG